jgi:hypothetical protein
MAAVFGAVLLAAGSAWAVPLESDATAASDAGRLLRQPLPAERHPRANAGAKLEAAGLADAELTATRSPAIVRAVPEPTTLVILGVSLTLLGAVRLRRK